MTAGIVIGALLLLALGREPEGAAPPSAGAPAAAALPSLTVSPGIPTSSATDPTADAPHFIPTRGSSSGTNTGIVPPRLIQFAPVKTGSEVFRAGLPTSHLDS